ncbi:MAG TPA: sigma 54-interacting transcriptional regulator [Polyangiaceae bacterium]
MSSVTHEAPTLLTAKSETPPESIAAYVLRAVEGPDAGRTLTLDGSRPGRLLIGSSPSCDFRLIDPQVSRRHCAVEATPRGLRVVDLGSTNGTWAGRTAIVDAYVAGGDWLRLGATTLTIEVAAPSQPLVLSSAMRFGRVVGASPGMRKLYPLCERLAASDAPVVIEGETGTGKELLAEALHEEGPRAQGPFAVFDCSAVPPSLVESTLFGQERGASTARQGLFEAASGGTLLIDEIGDLDPSLQPRLLRVLERGEVQRVGGDRWIAVDVRVLATTRRDLDAEVQAGRFREDLYHRLAVARIELPPLRARQGDVGLLVRHFWRKLDLDDQPLPDDVVARFETYAWPGNVRELRNAVARRLALGDLAPAPGAPGTTLPRPSAPRPATAAPSKDDFMSRVLARDLPLPRARHEVVDEFERRYVERVLQRHDGNVTRAANASGIARRYFYAIKNRVGV